MFGMNVARWEHITEWPLTIAAVGFLVAYAIPIIDPGDHPAAFHDATWGIWAIFAFDFVVRLALSKRRLRYLSTHLIDVLIIVLPLLRPLRMLRLVSLLKILNRRASATMRGRVTIYAIGGSLLLAFCGALTVLEAERASPGANIVTFGDAMWWAVTTMTTVGYGDRYPVTEEGRIAAAGLMIGGIALLGAVTATLASWLVQQVNAESQQTADLKAELDRIQAKLDRLVEAMSGRGRFDPGQFELADEPVDKPDSVPA
jgi:voltage-gated potassium channel